MRINTFGAYYAGAFRTAITSCFINGKISEQQIDFVKEVISKFREAEIDHLTMDYVTIRERRAEKPMEKMVGYYNPWD